MIRFMLSIVLLVAFVAAMQAQDVLYTIAGNKILAKVTEINLTDIKYKDFSNLEGPTYVISKTDVVLIQFKDGSSQIINANAPAYSPKSTEVNTQKAPDKKKQPYNLYYMNKNLLSINALALANGDVTLLYDREFLDSRLCLTFLGGYNFNSSMGALNAPIISSWDHGKKKYDAGLGISFMPRNTRRVQYFVGLLGKYMSYDFDELTTINNQSVITKRTGSQLAIMINNGWVFRITPSFNFKFFGAIGVPSYSPSLVGSGLSSIPKVYLGYCFGYRF